MLRSAREAVFYLLVLKPNSSTQELQVRLEELGFSCTGFLVAQLRRSVREDTRLFERVGLLRNRSRSILEEVRAQLLGNGRDDHDDRSEEEERPQPPKRKKRRPRPSSTADRHPRE